MSSAKKENPNPEPAAEAPSFSAAMEELEAILESRPHFVGARIRLGVVLQRLGDVDRAVHEWRRCMEEDPSDMRARAYLASVGVRYPALVDERLEPGARA